MAYSDGIITAPVSLKDVNRAIGASHTDLGCACTDANIKMWAKYKPVIKNLISTISQLASNKTWLSTATWWKGTNGNCGITYNSYTAVNLVKSAIDDGLVVWSYTKPTGGTTAPFRLTDFIQYNHNAKAPTSNTFATDCILEANAELHITALMQPKTEDTIGLHDVGSFGNYHYLAMVYDSNGTLAFLHTSPKKIGEYSDGELIDITIPWNNGTYGYDGKLVEGHTYKAYIVISSKTYTVSTNPQSGTYIPLPREVGSAGMLPASFKCYGSGGGHVLNAAVNGYIDVEGSTLCHWEAVLHGTLNPTTVTVRLIYASNKQVITSKTISFSAYSTQVSDGWKRVDRPNESFTLPDNNYPKYLIQVDYNGLIANGGIRQNL